MRGRGHLGTAAAIVVLVCVTATACQGEAGPASSAGPAAGPPAATDDAMLISKLLRLRLAAFEQAGGYDALGELKQWEELYGRTLSRALAEPDGSDEALRRFLLLGFIARARADAGISEAATADLMPLYQRRREAFLKILRELPYLAPSACHYLGASFGFEERDSAGKAPFLLENRPIIEQSLGPQTAAVCLESIDAAGGE